MRTGALAVLSILLLATGLSTAQYQPVEGPDWSGFTQRTDLAEAGELDGAIRVSRFVQVSDAHIIDDDAPYPMRQEVLDPFGSPFTSAQRPHEEYTDEVLDSMIGVINSIHADDRLDFVINTGDNIDNELENELMRFIDNWEGRYSTTGPVSGMECLPDGQSQGVDDDSNDVTDACTALPESFVTQNTPLATGLPWLSAFGNHDGLIQGNVPPEPSFDEIAAEYGRYFLRQHEYVGMHFDAGASCVTGMPAGQVSDDFGHGYGFAGDRLCDPDPDNDGYYAFDHRGIRFLVLDTVNDDFVTANDQLAGQFNPQQTLGYDLIGGYAEGSVDPAQFAWLLEEIESNPDRLILLFSHHTVNSMFSSETESQCQGDQCLSQALREAGYVTGPELIENLTRYPNVVGWIGGHTHQHRIQPKTEEGNPSPGFWNVESSSLIDLPQQARVIEIWQTADGSKGFLAARSVDHGFELSRTIAASDPQQHPDDQMGRPEDQDVILWFDIPEGIDLVPQPALPRFLVTQLVAPEIRNGSHGRVGENITVAVRVEDNLFDAPVGGLQATLTVRHADPETGDTVRAVQDAPMAERTNGEYAATFQATTGATHFADIRITDPSGTYDPVADLYSLDIQDVEPEEKKDSPAWMVVPLLLVLLVLARRLR